MHIKDIQRLKSEHESKINELKREYILQKDREKAAHQEQLKQLTNENQKVWRLNKKRSIT